MVPINYREVSLFIIDLNCSPEMSWFCAHLCQDILTLKPSDSVLLSDFRLTLRG